MVSISGYKPLITIFDIHSYEKTHSIFVEGYLILRTDNIINEIHIWCKLILILCRILKNL